MASPRNLVIITGGGTGIGRGLVHHFSKDASVVTCGRRLEALQEARDSAPRPGAVSIVQCDIGTEKGRSTLLAAIPKDPVRLLVHNAAIGDPGAIGDLNIPHFEQALAVNVVAPLALSQALLPQLKGGGRILHLGTSVAFNPQLGTTTYGVTKMAFHRLYQQFNAEGLGVPCASLSPGLVDTEGVQDHLAKARNLNLPHVAFFDKAYEQGWTTPMDELMALVEHLLSLDDETFVSKEWRFSEWRKKAVEANGKDAGSTLKENGTTLAYLAFGAMLAYGFHLIHSKL